MEIKLEQNDRGEYHFTERNPDGSFRRTLAIVFDEAIVGTLSILLDEPQIDEAQNGE